MVVETIEERPQPYDSPSQLVLNEKTQKLEPKKEPYNYSTQLRSWVAEHAVMRNFAPRLEPLRSVESIKHDPVKGYAYKEQYHGASIGTHPMELWENESGEKILLKGGPEHTLRADFVGQRLLARMGVRTPKTELVRVNGELKLKMEYMRGFKSGGIKLDTKHHASEKIQRGLFVDMLMGQYDRTPWNLMFPESGESDEVIFIDNGASLTSRARGGHKGFSENFTENELEELLSNPQFEGEPVNEAYQDLIQVLGGRAVGNKKKKDMFQEIWAEFRTKIRLEFLEEVVEEAGIPDGNRSIRMLEARIGGLEKELAGLALDSSDYKKTTEAIETYKKAIRVGGEATYLKKALQSRYNDMWALRNRLTFSDF